MSTMSTQTLDRAAWEDYFNRLSKVLEGKRATVEVASLDLGDQVEAEDIALLGITYDPKDDLVEVALDGLDHMIREPRTVQALVGDAGVEAVAITDRQGREQIVRFRDPLMLPAPGEA